MQYRSWFMKWLALVIVLGTCLPHAALAQSAASKSTDAPIEISSDTLEVDEPKQIAVFTGNVVAIQADMKLRSERMVVYYRKKDPQSADAPVATAEKSAIQRIEVFQNVVLATPDESAQGDRGVYEVDKKLLHLLGNVILTRSQNVLRGTQLDYNLATGRSALVGGNAAASSTGGRVRGVFMPDNGKN